MWLLLLLACTDDLVHGEPSCDPRALDPGEVRARPILCTDEALEDGDGRPGDWLVENAVARFAVRGVYGSLTELGEDGGTLIDAAAVGGADLLTEYLPDGDRSSIEAVNGDGYAALVLPGVTYRLDADSARLVIEYSTGGWLRGDVDADRTGAVLRDGSAFLGFDATLTADGGKARLDAVTGLAVVPDALWSTPAAGAADADTVLVSVEGVPVDRLPVVDGIYDGVVPEGATLIGERAGCVYEAFLPASCGTLRLRLEDGDGTALDGTLTDGVDTWYVPTGGGVLPVGPTPRTFYLWTGPTHAVTTVWYPGGEASADVALRAYFDPGSWVLADLAAEVAPDADTRAKPPDALRANLGDGVLFTALVADDAIPYGTRYSGDPVLGVDASRAAGMVWSWPWDTNTKRVASGVVPWEGLSPLDILAVSEGGESLHRTTVVTAAWVDAARAEAEPSAWTELPDIVYLAGPDEVPVYLGLLDAYVDVRPGGPRTWVDVATAVNIPSVVAGLVGGSVSAGNGPLVDLHGSRTLDRTTWELTVAVSAPAWMGVTRVTLVTDQGSETVDLVDGHARFTRSPDVRWAVATVAGIARAPWLPEPAWAVTQPVWIARP